MEQYSWAQRALENVTQQSQEERRRLWAADGTPETRTQRRERERKEKKAIRKLGEKSCPKKQADQHSRVNGITSQQAVKLQTA